MFHQEEPCQSSSIYAQFEVYELAKQQGVTVLLDGQGADETLAGYHKYYHWYWQELLGKGKWENANKERSDAKALGVRVDWSLKNYLAAYLPTLTAKQLEKRVVQQLHTYNDLTKDSIASASENKIYKPVVNKLNDILYFDTMQLGLEELLRYADRNSMAHSREVRLPFLNHELVQFIFSLSADLKIRGGWTKWILRHAMNNKLPESIVWRKDKVGFEPPQKLWMQQKQVQEYIHEARRTLVTKGILKAAVLDKPISEKSAHESGNHDWRYLCAASCM
jgi:asparagine synthase (glutamine-hydrolysing)